MTIGEKIKYCRSKHGISQAQLAKIGKIDISSIKKYETNKATPTYSQVKKIAAALGMSSLAFTDTYFEALRELETYGDLMGILIILRKNHLIQIDGERTEDGHILPETAEFKLNPLIGAFFSAVGSDTLARDMAFQFTNKDAFNQKLLKDLLNWEYVYTMYENSLIKYKDNNDESIKTALKENDEILGKIELELQYNCLMLEQTDGHLVVKINPDYGNTDSLMKEREKAIAKELKSQTKKSRSKKDDKNNP